MYHNFMIHDLFKMNFVNFWDGKDVLDSDWRAKWADITQLQSSHGNNNNNSDSNNSISNYNIYFVANSK